MAAAAPEIELGELAAKPDGAAKEALRETGPEPAEADGDIFSRLGKKAYYGFCAQYFAVGIMYGGISATTYPVFLGYLNVPGYVFSTVAVISSLPWNFKFFFGLLNDTVPVRGLKRKPYMVLGWSICAAVMLSIAMIPLPPPYWCIDEATGEYITKQVLPDGKHRAAVPCHPEAAEEGGKYAIMLMLAATGYVVADVAADGLTTEYAKQEPLAKRGSTQTTAYLTRTMGQAFSSLFVGLLMNSKLYNGSFEWGLSFEQMTFCLSLPCLAMIPISAFMVAETPKAAADEEQRQSCREYFAMCWELLKSKAFFYAIMFLFLGPVISGISTTAGPQVKMYWAGVKTFQNQMFSLVGSLLFGSGLWLVKTRFLNSSWRWMLIVTTVILQCTDMFFSTLTIFDVVRNQYFYLGETVLLEVPAAANFVVTTFIVVEMADEGNEGMVYGLMTTAGNLGNPFAQALGNQIFRLFKPSLSNVRNYIEDTVHFRWIVFASFMLSYAMSAVAMLLLPLLPSQKEEAQSRKQSWPRSSHYGYITVAVLSLAFVYSLTVDFMSMIPSTMCLRFAGGDGCDEEVPPTPLPPMKGLPNGTNSSLLFS